MNEPQDERRSTEEHGVQPTPTAHDSSANDTTEDTRVIETEQPTTEHPAAASATPGRPTGPHLPAILLGLACLVVAGLALAQELGHLDVDWGDVGPLGIVAAGAVLVVLGLVGLLTSRRRES